MDVAQVGALRAHAAEKDSGIASAREENSRLREGLGMYQKEVERLTSENRILKRAVGIQNTKGKEVRKTMLIVRLVAAALTGGCGSGEEK